MRPRIPPAQALAWLQQFQSGQTAMAIARADGRARSTVLKHLGAFGVKLRPGAPSMVERAPEWKKRYEAGESVRSIGRSCGVHWHTVLRQIKAAGAKIRGLRVRGFYA